eukprot:scaffold34643_cov62-Phaeocystis_antarctica.AAC.13
MHGNSLRVQACLCASRLSQPSGAAVRCWWRVVAVTCVGRGPHSSHPGRSLPAAVRAPAAAAPQPAAPCRSGRAARSYSPRAPAPEPVAARAAALASAPPPAARAATAARRHARARQGCQTRPAAPGPMWKRAAQRHRRICPPALIRPASVKSSSGWPPSSASLGQSSEIWPRLGAAARSRPSSLGTPRHSSRGTAEHGAAGRHTAAWLGVRWGCGFGLGGLSHELRTKGLDSLATLLAGRSPQCADRGTRERWVGGSAADRLAEQLLERSALAALADGERRTLERSKLIDESGEPVLCAGAGLWEAVRALRGAVRLCCDGRDESDSIRHVRVLKALSVPLDGGDDRSQRVRGWVTEERGLLNVGASRARLVHEGPWRLLRLTAGCATLKFGTEAKEHLPLVKALCVAGRQPPKLIAGTRHLYKLRLNSPEKQGRASKPAGAHASGARGATNTPAFAPPKRSHRPTALAPRPPLQLPPTCAAAPPACVPASAEPCRCPRKPVLRAAPSARSASRRARAA